MSVCLNPNIWGPPTWYVIHKIAFNIPQNYNSLPTKTKANLIRFYKNIKYLLPCSSCQEHYSWTLYKMPLDSYFTSGISISKWTVNAHNFTNKGLCKKKISFNKATNIYNKPGSENINHKLISDFILYIIINNGRKINYRKAVIKSFCYLHPCSKCREIYIKYLTKNSLKDVKTNKDMITWSKNLNKLYKKCY